MGRVIVEQIVSIDGYVEDAQGGIGFFFDAQELEATDQEQLRMLRSVGAIVFGARTYRMFADYWPQADPVAEPVPTRRYMARVPAVMVAVKASAAGATSKAMPNSNNESKLRMKVSCGARK